jgi:hypothetical protein
MEAKELKRARSTAASSEIDQAMDNLQMLANQAVVMLDAKEETFR